MDLKKIHHVAIIVSDYEVSRRFYVELLGFKVIRENYRPEKMTISWTWSWTGANWSCFQGSIILPGQVTLKPWD